MRLAPLVTSSRAMGAVLPASRASVPLAAQALRDGLVVALPTDTLYGLAAAATDAAAVRARSLRRRHARAAF